MKRTIQITEHYNPYKILDKLEALFDNLNFKLLVNSTYKVNRYRHSFRSGLFECDILNSTVSSNEFSIKVRVSLVDYEWLTLLDSENFNLEIKPNYKYLMESLNTFMELYNDKLSLETKRAMKIKELIG